MAAYGNMATAVAGQVVGFGGEVGSRVVASGITDGIPFGYPVFADEGVEETAYLPDSTDVSLHFAGVALLSPRSFVGDEGVYPAKDEISVLEKGQVWVAVASGITACDNKPAYVVNNTSSDDYGTFTTSDSGTYACGCFFRSNPDNGLAIVEVRGVK